MTYLVAYEYGLGAVWAMLEAPSPDVIAASCPALDVYEEPPPWMTGEDVEELRRHLRFELGGDGDLLDRMIQTRIALLAGGTA